jgi:hypothetical protein
MTTKTPPQDDEQVDNTPISQPHPHVRINTVSITHRKGRQKVVHFHGIKVFERVLSTNLSVVVLSSTLLNHNEHRRLTIVMVLERVFSFLFLFHLAIFYIIRITNTRMFFVVGVSVCVGVCVSTQ